MAYELRRPIFDLSGSLAASVASTDAQITGRGGLFTGLPTDYGAGSYLPLVIANDGLGKSEVVWVTGHAAASPTVTVVRGREGSSPQSFDAGDVVRCSPTLRDVVSAVATRTDLPSDAHYGCRVLILDDGQVVERTSSGWNDSSALEADPDRRHRWSQSNTGLAVVGSGTSISGLTGNQTGAAGKIATCTNGVLTLNRAGVWSLKLSGFGPGRSNANTHFGVGMKWTNGAFLSDPYQIVGQAANANTLVECTWVGYADAVAVTRGIGLFGFTNVAYSGGCQWDITAEYLGA